MTLIRLFAQTLFTILFFVQTAAAGSIGILRDADIENALSELARPILAAAGRSPSQVRVLLVDDRSLNAFVVDSRTIFINSGLLLRLDTAEMVQAVIAHEVAHIANGHIARRLSQMGVANAAAAIGLAVAAAAAASGNSEAAMGLAVGSAESARRLSLTHTRAEEGAADKSGGTYMVRAGIDPRAAVAVHDIFKGQELLSVGRVDPYVLSHPLSSERARAMAAFANAQKKTFTPNKAAQYWHSRAKGKLSAYTLSSSTTIARVGKNPTTDIDHMRLAIAYSRKSNLKKALEHIDAAIAARPKDGYYYDLRGEILLKGRKFNDAVAAYKTALSLAPDEGLILSGYGRAVLATGNTKAAIEILERARALDPNDTNALRDLAQAYGREKQTGMASLVSAERAAVSGDLKTAITQAKRAEKMLPRGSSGWNRAMDILQLEK